MTSLRHKNAIATITHDAHRLTVREREAIGLPAHPLRRKVEPPAFPSNPADYVWFALTTKPQGEAHAVQALSRLGFAAFNPTEVVVSRAARGVKFKRKERERAMLTSTVLAGFRGKWVERRKAGKLVEIFHADVPWLHVLQLGPVTGVIGMGDGPVPVPMVNVLVLHARCGRRAPSRDWSASVGDSIEISFGAFKGRTGQIVELADGKAMVTLFGATGLLAGLSKPLPVPEAWVRFGDGARVD